MVIRKKDGKLAEFDRTKIYEAIMKAMKYGTGIISKEVAEKISIDIEKIVAERNQEVTVAQIEEMVYLKLIEYKQPLTARSYEGYRAIQAFRKKSNTTDDGILSLVERTNADVMNENSNKDAVIVSTQRDLIAGEVSKDISRRKKLPTKIVQAHDDGVLHFHDMDYFLQEMFNCFSGDTRFISDRGTVSFEEIGENQEILVPTHTGEWKKAIVKKYGKQDIYENTFIRNGKQTKKIKSTLNHRWFLKDGNISTQLEIGDSLVETPVIERFDFDSLTEREKLMWCIGFGLGDGREEKQSETNYGISIRICGRKSRFNKYFEKSGLNVTQPQSFNGDYLVRIPKESKENILEKYNTFTMNEKIALFNGLLCADGHFRNKEYATGIQTSDKRIKDLVLSLAEMSGYYIGAIQDLTGKETNFIKNRKETWLIHFNRKQYRAKWKLIERTPIGTMDAWCLEVEDNHSFILSGGIVTGNCCLVDIGDMLDNGTVINKRMIESPKSFQVACTVMTQIIAQVASSQYGGQSIDIKHLGKYLRRSKERYAKMFGHLLPKERKEVVDTLVQKELESGVQTIQYQINTLMTTNGQSPFVTLFLNIDEEDEYVEEIAQIVEEILKERLQGIKNEQGVYTTPAFPKLVYVLYEHNSFEGGKYDYITEVAVRCNAKRIYPDYISANEMRKIYEGNVFSCMGCRSFLSPYIDENGNYKFEGRFNQGVVSINLPQIGIIANGDEKVFWELLDNRLDLCFEALMCRHNALKGTISDVSPMHWQHGAIARLKKGETIDKLLMNGYSTISLGYIGLYEVTKAMKGVSHTDKVGEEFALRVMNHLKETVDRWKEETGLGFGLYGSPAESLCYRFAKIDKIKFGDIKDITDKEYYTNSYHVDVREEIDAFSKLKFESQFQPISTGGCISYIEIPNVSQNINALKQVVNFIYHNIQYAEINTKSDYCHECGFDGEIIINDQLEWECPNCHNKNRTKMNVIRRTCGYLGENFWNIGKTKEMKSRVLHL